MMYLRKEDLATSNEQLRQFILKSIPKSGQPRKVLILLIFLILNHNTAKLCLIHLMAIGNIKLIEREKF
jgi:hypothetical protein